MNLLRIQHRLRKSLAQRGALATAAAVLRKALAPPARSEEKPKPYAALHPYDQKFGVETSGLIHPEDLAAGKEPDLYNTGYFGVAPSVFRLLVDRLALDFEQYTFVDLGSGKGRALFLASEYPFRAVVGVELSPLLHAVAEANIANYRGPVQRCRDVRSTEGDAAKFAFPPGPLVIYMWNPFEAPVFARVLANVEASLRQAPRNAYIMYIQPDLDHLLEASRYLEKLWRVEIPMSEEDYGANAFPTRTEICSVYRSVTPAPLASAKVVVSP